METVNELRHQIEVKKVALMQDAMSQIKAERQRQITEEGYTARYDDNNEYELLVMAAATYEMDPKEREEFPTSWPWEYDKWKPSAKAGRKGRIRELVKAGALYLAAKDAMERQEVNNGLKQAVCEKIDLMVESIAVLMEEELDA
jgi:hypothetical protein